MIWSVDLSRPGACLPEDSAPPRPAKLWHCAQLSRNSSPPSPRSPPRRLSPTGSRGPPPIDCTYAAIWLTSSSVYFGGFSLACASCRASGIRPVATWKYTAAWPTPSARPSTAVPDARRRSRARRPAQRRPEASFSADREVVGSVMHTPWRLSRTRQLLDEVDDGEQATDHVQAVEAGGEVEDRAVAGGGDGGPFPDQHPVLVRLAEHEQQAQHEGVREPLAQPVHVAALGGEHPELAGERRGDQDDRHRQRVRDVQPGGLHRPVDAVRGPDREVHREQPGEEHQLAGQPHDGPDADHVRPGQRVHLARLEATGVHRGRRHAGPPRRSRGPRASAQLAVRLRWMGKRGAWGAFSWAALT